MSVETNDTSAPILARAAVAERRAERRLATAIDDFFLAEADRLDDRTRGAIAAAIEAIVATAQREIAHHAARSIGTGAAATTLADDAAVLPRLIDSGLLRDAELMTELVGQVRQELLATALRANRAPDAAPGLLTRLIDCGDGVIEAAARDYLLADSRRSVTLPAPLQRRVAWWIAAALRERTPRDPAIDRAIAEATTRSLAAHDDGLRAEAIAVRLADAIDARPDELGDLLVEALTEGRAALFVALVARAQTIDYAEARELVLDPDGDRLWLALRARGLDRATIARIGLALADADHRRDIEAFADQLDTIAAIPAGQARETLAPLALHRDFRVALRALARTAR